MYRFLTLFVVLALASHACAILKLSETLAQAEEKPIVPAEYDGENADFDYKQYVAKGPLEIEVDEERDADFDNQVCDQEGRPTEPSADEIQKVFDGQVESVAAEAKAGGLDVSTASLKLPTPFAYFTDRTLWKPKLKCCPRRYNYGCRHTLKRMPCFVNYHHNLREWCCPIWPKIYTANCDCDKCHIQTNTCIHSGRCLKRYTRRSFLAVCYRHGAWANLRFFNKWIPTSCFCSARKYPYIAMEDQVSAAQHCPK